MFFFYTQMQLEGFQGAVSEKQVEQLGICCDKLPPYGDAAGSR
jgi:hypothetical protein